MKGRLLRSLRALLAGLLACLGLPALRPARARSSSFAGYLLSDGLRIAGSYAALGCGRLPQSSRATAW